MAEVKRIVPIPDGDSEFYWNQVNAGLLFIQHCQSCDKHIFYPRIVCPHCMSGEIEWVEASGKGSVYSYTVVHRAPDPSFAEDCPYVVALIDLEEGVRMMSNIVNTEVGNVYCGMQVEVVFENAGEVKLPKFQPVPQT